MPLITKVAAPLVRGSGSFLYAVHGAWVYPIAIGSLAGPSGVVALSCATLFEALFAAMRRASFRIHFSLPALALRLGGGSAMGFGSALIPGGNGTLILLGLPSLSPHAPVAYAALALGAGLTLFVSPALRRAAALLR